MIFVACTTNNTNQTTCYKVLEPYSKSALPCHEAAKVMQYYHKMAEHPNSCERERKSDTFMRFFVTTRGFFLKTQTTTNTNPQF